MKTYQHTQTANWILFLLAAVGLSPLVIGPLHSRPMPFVLFLLLPIMLVLGWLFRSLTIEITGDELRWRFGPGWIHKRVPLTEVASAKAVRTNLIEGWGIHYSRFGWLYNVSGFDAVAICLKNGKRFCLGTDEPEKLAAQLDPTIVIKGGEHSQREESGSK
jgi:hypothetical protein